MVERKALVQVVLATALWGAVFSVGKLLSAELPPMAVTFLRYGIAALIVLPLAAPELRRLSREDLPALAAAGAMSSVIFNGFVFSGLRLAPAGDAALAPAVSPILVTVAGVVLFGQRPSPQRILCLAVATTGIALVFSANLAGGSGDTRIFGDLLHLGGAVAWASYLVLAGRLGKRHSAKVLTSATVVVGAGGALPLAILEGGLPDVLVLSTAGWFQVLYIALLGSVAAFLLWSRGVASLGPERASLFMNLVPLFGLAGSVLVLRESLGLLQIAGTALVIGGVAAATLVDRRRSRMELAAAR
ncbi:DMT family transporter [Vulgatibacter sp.]|uniref:DMT family transporter n=1 Tax=Vulgatibacter sp. TaxID=1971226 RepID=UPI003565B0EC